MVKEGDRVKIRYTGRLEDGTVFDSTEGWMPIEFTVGKGEYFPRLEQAVIGMVPGESKTIRIPMEEAYGPHKPERVFEFDRKKAPQGFDPSIGEWVQMYRIDGKPIKVKVIGKSATSFIMDCNHPLAGKDLIVDITLEEIVR